MNSTVGETISPMPTQFTTGPISAVSETDLYALDGLIPNEVCRALRALAQRVPAEQAIVEVGSYKGKSTCSLASAASAHVWAVDPWDLAGNETGRHRFAESSTRLAFEAQVASLGLGDRITAIQGFSVAVAEHWDGPPIGLLYIDGDHRYKAVRADFLAWRPHLASGATVIFDDLDTPRNPGVRKVVDELAELLRFEVWAGRLAVGRY